MPSVVRLQIIPPSVSGRSRHDALLTLATVAVAASQRRHHDKGAGFASITPLSASRTQPLTVIGRDVVAADGSVIARTLAAPDESPLPQWRPGAHLDVRLPGGRLRHYSLCGDPCRRDRYRIAVRRIPDGGGGSAELHQSVDVGTALVVGRPRNAFLLSHPGRGSRLRRIRFIAGGIGTTPILPMITRAHQFGVDWALIYLGRSRDSLPFLEEVACFGDRVRVRTDDVDGPPPISELTDPDSGGTAFYVCGPPPLLTAVHTDLISRHDVELHAERFTASPVVDGREFTAVIPASGLTVEIGATETLLAALRRAGVPAPYSCLQGFCGICRLRALDGVVDHRDTSLTEPEREAGTLLACVSRAKPNQRLTLELPHPTSQQPVGGTGERPIQGHPTRRDG